jgi:hypothetical protein
MPTLSAGALVPGADGMPLLWVSTRQVDYQSQGIVAR